MKAMLAFLLGAALAAAVVWNPFHWAWANGAVARLHPPMAMGGATQGAAAAASAPQGQRKILYWHDPMLPNYISNKPGKSPMGMDLIPVYADEEPQGSGIRVNPNFVQNFGVLTATAVRGTIPVDIRTVGILDYNQKNLALVNTKYEGWIEKVAVNYVGQPVTRGEELFEIYSPQLVTTEQEYLSTLEYVRKLEGAADADAMARARSLLAATRERLRYWDITDAQIDQLKSTGRIARTLKVFSPVTGVVMAKADNALEGMKVEPGMTIYKIADLSTVWGGIQVYEDQVRYVRVGTQAAITVDAFPNRRWTARVVYIDPNVDPQTRTLKVYVEIPNPDGILRPQMYANVEISVPVVTGAVKIPEEAVLHSGVRSVVIVEKPNGLFDPRPVELGALGGGYREILKGIEPGEKVVTSSQFLIDSESNLKEAVQKMMAGESGNGKGH